MEEEQRRRNEEEEEEEEQEQEWLSAVSTNQNSENDGGWERQCQFSTI